MAAKFPVREEDAVSHNVYIAVHLFRGKLLTESPLPDQFVIMDDDLNKIGKIIKISRKTMTIVKTNIVFALTVKFLVLGLGAFGIANMWAAVFADVGVATLCILNSMRMLRYK